MHRILIEMYVKFSFELCITECIESGGIMRDTTFNGGNIKMFGCEGFRALPNRPSGEGKLKRR